MKYTVKGIRHSRRPEHVILDVSGESAYTKEFTTTFEISQRNARGIVPGDVVEIEITAKVTS